MRFLILFIVLFGCGHKVVLAPIATIMRGNDITQVVNEVDQASEVRSRYSAETIAKGFNVKGDNIANTRLALDHLIAVGVKALKDRGWKNDATEIATHWAALRPQFLVDSGNGLGKVGDHAAIAWLLAVGNKLRSLLGDEVDVVLHLDDLIIFAYSIPVVFGCEDQVSQLEYALHFVGQDSDPGVLPGDAHGFAPSLTFWVVDLGCDIGVPIPGSLLCAPVAVMAERIMYKRLAPRLNPTVWARSCDEVP